MPAGDLDVLDEQPQQCLALGVVERADDRADAAGEVLDAGLFYVSWWGQFLGSGPYFVTVTSPRAGSSLAILNDPGRYGT